MIRIFGASLFAALAAVSCSASADVLQGKVIYVDDGDTAVVIDSGNQKHKIRLANIDAPETSHTKSTSGRIGQPFSDASRRSLDELIKGKLVTANCFEIDRYERQVCDILLDGRSVSTEQVRRGFAWANQSSGGRYLRDKTLMVVEGQARAAGLGLWAEAKPVPPWEWRKECWGKGYCEK